MSHRPFPGRRSVLRGSLAASAALTLPTALGAAPAFALSGRPKAGWGVQTGDVTTDSGLVWVRSDRPARMIVETSATESFRNPRRWHGQNLRAFNAQVPSIIQWDDHEVTNNWYPGEILGDSRYTEKNVDVLASRARQAFSEYYPISTLRRPDGRVYRTQHYGPLLDVFVLDMRTYRNANSPDNQTTDPVGILGREQLEWLKRELSRSRAVWKVIASDMPIGLVVPDAGDGKPNLEAVAQGDPGAPLGRELQIAELLRFIKHRRITGTVWLTADVHYTSAQHYQPSRAAFTDFEPFWEFVSGPLNAGGFPANALDNTFGPERVFLKAPTVANVSPAEGYQFFGEVDIDGDSGELTVRLREQDGTVLFTQVLQPGRVGQ